MVYEVLQESVQSVAEALSMWSSIHAEEQGRMLTDWSQQVITMLGVADAVGSVWIFKLFDEIAPLLTETSPVDGEFSDLLDFMESQEGGARWDEFGGMSFLVDSWRETEKRIADSIESFSIACKALSELPAFEEERRSWAAWYRQVCQAAANQDARKTVVQLLYAIKALKHVQHPPA